MTWVSGHVSGWMLVQDGCEWIVSGCKSLLSD